MKCRKSLRTITKSLPHPKGQPKNLEFRFSLKLFCHKLGCTVERHVLPHAYNIKLRPKRIINNSKRAQIKDQGLQVSTTLILEDSISLALDTLCKILLCSIV